MDSSFDDEDEGWGYPYSTESLVDEIDRLSDICNDLEGFMCEWDLS